jgi:hypothetical protein
LVLTHGAFDEYRVFGYALLIFDALGLLTTAALAVSALLLFGGYYRT